MKFKIAAAFSVFVLLAGCNNDINNEEMESADNDTTDIKELVHEYSTGDIPDQTATISANELIVTDNEDDRKTVYELPEDEFFVSIAPFLTETHPCFDHSLTGCQGEMVNKDLDIFIEDEDGNVLLNEGMQTMKNGFIDLWLPRGQTFNVKISHDGKQVESEISTFEEDGTCVTTMQLT